MKSFLYADDTSREDWQKEYKYGAFYIFPPHGVIEPIDELRQTYDPTSASYCQAHISLSEPLCHPFTDEQLHELKTALSSIKPFEMHYGPLRIFPPYPGITYAIQPEDAFMHLRTVIHATSLFIGISLKHKDIAPHMTIAEFITIERTEELLKELSAKVPEGKFLCESIEYAIPNKHFSFERVLTIPLGG
jgi:2'-5' RNA ligase